MVLWNSFLIKKLLKNVICEIREQYIDALFIVDKVNYCELYQKNKKRKRKTQMSESLQSKQAQNLCIVVRKRNIVFDRSLTKVSDQNITNRTAPAFLLFSLSLFYEKNCTYSTNKRWKI